jgi:hypothetical protein
MDLTDKEFRKLLLNSDVMTIGKSKHVHFHGFLKDCHVDILYNHKTDVFEWFFIFKGNVEYKVTDRQLEFTRNYIKNIISEDIPKEV